MARAAHPAQHPGREGEAGHRMPVLEDANSIQCAIMQVMSLLLGGQIEHKTAALLLYGLQTASANLRHTMFEPYPRQVVINPATVGETHLGEDVWQNSDFNGKEKDDSSPEKNLQRKPDPLPANWRDDVRTQIATLVKKRAPHLIAAGLDNLGQHHVQRE
jgi:hypothetical protein